MAEETQPKWEGRATAELKGSTAEQIWPFLEDFCNIDKFYPNLDKCYRVEGTPGQPGLVRHCATKIGWANEKLLTIDRTNRCLNYEVLENTAGFKNYVATLKVLPTEGDGEPAGCKIEWSFIADPFEGWRLEDLVSHRDYCLQFMAKKMEDAIKAQIYMVTCVSP
ncbi:Polyketide cyclase/dehydrase - like 10 [Theobroma cacao]|nr:Polyketide cyclase/dehydrase - like 10 [Theobroma cacao]